MRAIRSMLTRSAVLLLLGAMLLMSGCAEEGSRTAETAVDREKITLIGQDVSFVRWSPDGSKLAVVTRAGFLALYEAVEGGFQFTRTLDKHTGYINGRSLAWSADGSKIYYYDRPIDEKTKEPAPLEYGSLLTSADWTTGKVTNVHPQFIQSVSAMDVAPDGGMLYINTYERRKYSIVTFQLHEGLHHDLTQQLAVNPAGDSRLSRDGKLLFVNEQLAEADRYQGVIIELNSGKKRIISDRYLGNVSFSPDGRWLAYVGTDHAVYVIPTDRQADATAIVQSDRGAVTLDWSPQGDRLALTAAAAEAGGYSLQLYIMEVPEPFRPDANN